MRIITVDRKRQKMQENKCTLAVVLIFFVRAANKKPGKI